MKKPPAVFFAATHRSGSTLLMETLKRMDWIGRPGEAFYPQNIAELLRRLGKDPDMAVSNWLHEVIAAGRSPSGWFSSKIFADNMRWLASQTSPEPWPQSVPNLVAFFKEHFPEAAWIRIRRRDTLRQGISLLKALQSGLWHSTQRKVVRARRTYYQRDLIEWAVHNIQQQEKTLDTFFAELGAEPEVLFYEDFSRDIPGALNRIGLCLRLEVPPLPAAGPTLERLSNRDSETWVERWHQEEADARECPQALLTDPQKPVFSAQVHLPSEPVLPGSRIEVPLQLRGLRREGLRFIGRNGGGSGGISLWLRILSPEGNLELERRLPNPYQLQPNETAELLFHLDVPRHAATFTLEISARQNGAGPLALEADGPWTLQVSDQLASDLRRVFGEVQVTPDNWHYSPWFGYFYANAFPWILSVQHGWLRVEPESSLVGGLSVYDFVLGPWRTSQACFPAIQLQDGTELRHLSTENSRRTFKRGDGSAMQVGVSEEAPSASD